MKRFVAVMNVPAPYRQHLFNELWSQLKERGIDFHVHYMARGFGKARPDSWTDPQIDFPHTYWKNCGTSEHQFNPGLLAHLFLHQPDWLMCGSSFYTPTGIALMNGCVFSHRIAWVEGNTKTPGELGGLKGFVKRLVLSRCRSVAVPGHDGVEYIKLHQQRTCLRMPKPVILPNLVDERLFDIARPVNRTGDRVCFVPARFVWDKGLVEFFEAIEKDMLDGWKIRILGHGPLQGQVEEIIRQKGLGTFVEIIPSVPYEQVPAYYQDADLFLLPSVHDQNPLSVVEALWSGLPITLSEQAGNVYEAVTEGVNGWILPVMEVSSYKQKLRTVFSTSRERLVEMGAVSRQKNAKFWTTRLAIRGFLDNVLSC